MGLVDKLVPVHTANELLTKFGSPLLLLYFRWYVAWVFLKAGLFKINDWELTLTLFEYEYAVPFYPSNSPPIWQLLESWYSQYF